MLFEDRTVVRCINRVCVLASNVSYFLSCVLPSVTYSILYRLPRLVSLQSKLLAMIRISAHAHQLDMGRNQEQAHSGLSGGRHSSASVTVTLHGGVTRRHERTGPCGRLTCEAVTAAYVTGCLTLILTAQACAPTKAEPSHQPASQPFSSAYTPAPSAAQCPRPIPTPPPPTHLSPASK